MEEKEIERQDALETGSLGLSWSGSLLSCQIIQHDGGVIIPESSKKIKRVRSLKVSADQEDRPGRYFAWPRELFIELTLSRRQVLKVRRWLKKGHHFFPMWFCTFSGVLFVDQEAFEEWCLNEGKRGKP